MKRYSTSIKGIIVIFSFLLFSCGSDKNKDIDFTTKFEQTNGLETPEYDEVIQYYINLSDVYRSISTYELDKTDSGKPLHLVTFNPNRTLESEFSGERDKNILLINNGIHPGESDGIDASMMLMRDLAEGKITAPKNTIIAVIPIYNIGGALNRNSTTRTNQNGPKSYGFRGNARNYDLNRDFIKSDTKNARAFAKIFKMVKPDLFIDNHVSNGADYQYVLTHLFTQHNKLGGPLGNYLNSTFVPALEDSLQNKSWDITPYVNVFNRVPENGFSQFFDSPRYSTGYAALFNTLGMMVETHMLKPYKQRVEGTYELMKSFIAIADHQHEVIKELKTNAATNFRSGDYYPLQWEIDSSKVSTLDFKGYEAEKISSQLTGSDRLQYDSTKPFTKQVTYYNNFKPKDSILIPEKYIIPQGYWNVIELLRLNGVQMSRIEKDTLLNAEVYKIDSFETVNRPYEGHYLHYNTQVSTNQEPVLVKQMDYVVNTKQPAIRYILETLEPAASDSFFNWNFFDAILQQKEGFSPYVWEDIALEFLEENPALKKEFMDKKEIDPEFSKNWYAQLDWIHKHSPYYEASHLRYPIIRVGS